MYGALNDDIRDMLRRYQAANKQRGPLFAFLFRTFNNARGGRPDVTFHLQQHAGDSATGSSTTAIHCHKAILCACSSYFRDQFAGRWAGKRDVYLTDPRMDGTALSSVLSYMYTERLVIPQSHLRSVQALARNLRLAGLRAFLSRYKPPVSDDPDRVLAVDLGAQYRVGSFAFPVADAEAHHEDESADDGDGDGGYSSVDWSSITDLDVKRLLSQQGVRQQVWLRLLRSGVVPSTAFEDLRPSSEFDDADAEEAGGDGDGGGTGSYGGRPSPADAGTGASRSSTASTAAAATGNSLHHASSFAHLHHDLEIVVRGVVFRAHAAIVCGRSKYLESMLSFQHGQSSSSLSSSSSAAAAAPVERIELGGMSPFVLGVLLEWMYADVCRPIPTPALALEALEAADVFLLNDGLKPLLVAQAIRHISLDTLVSMFSVAELYQLHRLTEAAARFAALELHAVLALPGFDDLVRASAASIKGRQEYDSVPIIDDIKTEITNCYGGRGAAYCQHAVQGYQHNRSGQTAAAVGTRGSDVTAATMADLAADVEKQASQAVGSLDNSATNGIDGTAGPEDGNADGVDPPVGFKSPFDGLVRDGSTGSGHRYGHGYQPGIAGNTRGDIADQDLWRVFAGRTRGAAAIAAAQAGIPNSTWKIAAAREMMSGVRADHSQQHGTPDEPAADLDSSGAAKPSEPHDMPLAAEFTRRMALIHEYALNLGFKMRR